MHTQGKNHIRVSDLEVTALIVSAIAVILWRCWSGLPPSPDVPRAVAMPWGCQAVLLGLGTLIAVYTVLGLLLSKGPPCDD